MDISGSDKTVKINRGWFNDCSSPTANEVLFIVQVLVIFIVVITSIVNLSLQNGDSNLWTALLSCSIGYVIPNPNPGAKTKTIISNT